MAPHPLAGPQDTDRRMHDDVGVPAKCLPGFLVHSLQLAPPRLLARLHSNPCLSSLPTFSIQVSTMKRKVSEQMDKLLKELKSQSSNKPGAAAAGTTISSAVKNKLAHAISTMQQGLVERDTEVCVCVTVFVRACACVCACTLCGGVCCVWGRGRGRASMCAGSIYPCVHVHFWMRCFECARAQTHAGGFMQTHTHTPRGKKHALPLLPRCASSSCRP